MAFFAFGRIDRFGKFGAQRIAIEMAGQFVAGGEIGKPLLFAPALGDFAHHADDALGGAVLIGNALAQHDEPYRAHRRRQFDVDIEMPVLAPTAFENRAELVTPFRTHQTEQCVSDAGIVGDELVGKNPGGAAPYDSVVGDRPVERDNTCAGHGQLQPLRVLRGAQQRNTVCWLLLKRTVQHVPPPQSRFSAVVVMMAGPP